MTKQSNIISISESRIPEPSKALLLRGAEIILKGKNRRLFETQLLRNIRRSIGDLAPFDFKKVRASYLLQFSDVPGRDIIQRLQEVFGLSYIAPVYESELKIEALLENVTRCLPRQGVRSFAVRSRRLNRNFPYNTQELNEVLGAAIQQQTSWAVDLKNPDLVVNVDVMNDIIYYHWERYTGLRGLPVGVSGKVIVMLSGGIDSPVAAFQLASRGCLPVYVHFHSAPYTSRASIEKAMEVVRKLETYHYQTRVYLVPFAEIQKEIVTQCPDPLRVILYRRFMVRLADRIARAEKSQALVTGESVAQVASQTLANLRSIEAVTSIPILRPLIGCDKQEIVERARKIGTYDISIQPDQDCCSYLMPQKPATHTRVWELEEAEQELDVEALVRQTMRQIEKRTGTESSYPFSRIK
jgi:thiamine biosynthesis protein ThiI